MTTPTMISRTLARPVVPNTLEVAPQIDAALDQGDGQGEWHENAEMRGLRRVMTAEEQHDAATYDGALYRARAASLARLRARYGEVWMLVPKRENRGRAWLPERIYKGVAA